MKRLALLLLFAVPALAQSTLTPNVQFQLPAYQQTNWQVPINYNFQLLDALMSGSAVLPTGATPSISQVANWFTQNATATTITNFVNGLPGQTITLFCGPGDTFTQIANSANISVPATFSCATATSITFKLFGSVWTESSTTSAITGGTVTSVTITVPSWLTATGCTITTSGTCAITGTSVAQNLFLASPNGSSGAVTPRAIVAGDLTGAVFYQTVQSNGTSQTQQPIINLIPGTNVTITCANATGKTNCTFAASSTASTAWSGITAATNSNTGSFIATGNTWDFSGAVLFKQRIAAGCTTTTNGDSCYDSTSSNWHDYNGADAIRVELAAGYVSGNCPQPTQTAGKWVLADSGTPCAPSAGTGSMTVYNTPASAMHTGIGPITMATVGGTDQNYQFSVQIAQTNTTSGCATSPHVSMIVSYTQAQTNVARIPSPTWFTETGLPSGTTYFLLPLNSAPTNNVVGYGTLYMRAKAGTTISYTSSYISGSCSSEATYSLSPNLVQQ